MICEGDVCYIPKSYFNKETSENVETLNGFWSFLFGLPTIGTLLDQHDQPATISSMKPIVIFYWSAYWCPPCQNVSPKLMKFMEDNKDEISVVYMGADHNATMQEENLFEKPFHKFTYSEKKREMTKEFMKKYPSARGYPTAFAVERDSGNILTEKAVDFINISPGTAISMWKNGEAIVPEETVKAYYANLFPSDESKFPEDVPILHYFLWILLLIAAKPPFLLNN